MILMFLTGSSIHDDVLDGLQIWLNLLSLVASRTPSKIGDISRVLAGVVDDFDFS